jgi:sortase A
MKKDKITIFGILLVVAGLVMMGWAFLPSYFDGLHKQDSQKAAAEQIQNSWDANVVTDDNSDRKKVDTPDSESLDALPEGTVFGLVTVPSFGADWKVPLAQGTNQNVLDTVGAGHYKSTEGPGETGNFVLAGHNGLSGFAVFQKIPELKVGDEVVVDTKTKRYVYKFRSSEIVKPNQSDVLYPVPHQKGAKPTEKLLTMTTCWPAWSDEERWISYSVLDRVEDR